MALNDNDLILTCTLATVRMFIEDGGGVRGLRGRKGAV